MQNVYAAGSNGTNYLLERKWFNVVALHSCIPLPVAFGTGKAGNIYGWHSLAKGLRIAIGEQTAKPVACNVGTFYEIAREHKKNLRAKEREAVTNHS